MPDQHDQMIVELARRREALGGDGDKKEKLSLSISSGAAKAIRAMAVVNGCSISRVLEERMLFSMGEGEWKLVLDHINAVEDEDGQEVE